jgi:pyruvate dehydrogenase (quinone)
MLGFEGIKCDKPKDVPAAWERALTADRPVVLEFVTDPQIVALPPHVKKAQLKKTAKGLASGDEDAVGIAEKGFKGKLTEFTEHVKEKLPGGDD